MSSASSHSGVISRKPSGSCLIHPSISSSSSDYDEGEEFDLLGESLKQPNPEDLLVRPTRPLCPSILDSNLFSHRSKRYITPSKTVRSILYILYISFPSCIVLFPDTQLSSILLPTSRLRSLSRSKSKSKSNRHLSSNAFSHSSPPNQPRHHECLPQDSESLRASTSANRKFSPSHLKFANNLKLKYLDSTSRSLNTKISTVRPKPVSYPSILPYIPASYRCGRAMLPPHCISFVVLCFIFLSSPLLPLLSRFRPPLILYTTQALVSFLLTKQSSHVLVCPIAQCRFSRMLWKPLC